MVSVSVSTCDWSLLFVKYFYLLSAAKVNLSKFIFYWLLVLLVNDIWSSFWLNTFSYCFYLYRSHFWIRSALVKWMLMRNFMELKANLVTRFRKDDLMGRSLQQLDWNPSRRHGNSEFLDVFILSGRWSGCSVLCLVSIINWIFFRSEDDWTQKKLNIYYEKF